MGSVDGVGGPESRRRDSIAIRGVNTVIGCGGGALWKCWVDQLARRWPAAAPLSCSFVCERRCYCYYTALLLLLYLPTSIYFYLGTYITIYDITHHENVIGECRSNTLSITYTSFYVFYVFVNNIFMYFYVFDMYSKFFRLKNTRAT